MAEHGEDLRNLVFGRVSGADAAATAEQERLRYLAQIEASRQKREAMAEALRQQAAPPQGQPPVQPLSSTPQIAPSTVPQQAQLGPPSLGTVPSSIDPSTLPPQNPAGFQQLPAQTQLRMLAGGQAAPVSDAYFASLTRARNLARADDK